MSTPMFEIPEHLPMPVDRDGQGPVSEDEAHSWVCWCGQPGCQLTKALQLACEAGTRRLVLHPRLEDRIAETLAKRHKCLDHNGPGSGPCRTDRERATLIMGVLSGAMLFENRRDKD